MEGGGQRGSAHAKRSKLLKVLKDVEKFAFDGQSLEVRLSLLLSAIL